MAPGRRRKMAGMMRDDVARDAMKKFGFNVRVINDTIKELLELYGGGVEAWRFIEDDSYSVLLSQCLENQEKQEKQVNQEEKEEEQHEPVVQEQEQRVDTDASSTTREAVMDTSAAASPVEGGWVSDEDTDPEEDGRAGNAPAPAAAVDSDDEMIQLTPEPLCEELQELLREVQARNKRKRV